MLNALTQQHSTFTRQDLARFIDRYTDGAEQFAHVLAKVEASAELVRPNVVSTFVVNSTADGNDVKADGICQTSTAGQCTLRAAITEANRAAGSAEIDFNIPGTTPAPIAPASPLPPFNNPNGISVQGFTQPGSHANTDPIADNAVYGVELRK